MDIDRITSRIEYIDRDGKRNYVSSNSIVTFKPGGYDEPSNSSIGALVKGFDGSEILVWNPAEVEEQIEELRRRDLMPHFVPFR